MCTLICHIYPRVSLCGCLIFHIKPTSIGCVYIINSGEMCACVSVVFFWRVCVSFILPCGFTIRFRYFIYSQRQYDGWFSFSHCCCHSFLFNVEDCFVIPLASPFTSFRLSSASNKPRMPFKRHSFKSRLLCSFTITNCVALQTDKNVNELSNNGERFQCERFTISLNCVTLFEGLFSPNHIEQEIV